MRAVNWTSRALGVIVAGATLIAVAGSALADDKPEFAKWFRYSPDVEAAWKLYINAGVAKLAGMIAYRREQLDVARAKFEEGHRMDATDCELGFYLGLVNAEQRRWPQTADVFVETATCLQNAQREYTEEIAQIQRSNASEERKARQIARREKLIRDAERMIATSWFNTAVASFNLSRKAEARQYAEKVADDQQFGERARELLSRLEKEKREP